MNRTTAIATAAIAVLLFAGAAAAQRRVAIGGATFELGAARKQTLAEARAHFEVSAAGKHGHYNLYRKRASSRRALPLPRTRGSITVRDNRLVRVVRNLGSFRSTQGEAAVENMIAAFAEAPNPGTDTDNTPSVHTDTSLAGDASTSRVYFTYPDRTIQIVIYRPASRSTRATVDITEQYALRERRPAPPTPR